MAPTLTRKEVSQHNTNKSAWFVVGNKVYDVTKFLDEEQDLKISCEVLLEQAGRDATEAFEDVGHSTDARQMREQYYVGDIVEEEKQTYSYDKKTWTSSSSDNQQRSASSNPLEALIYPGLIAIVVALTYYLLFN
ncbi:putative cytochrome b5 [Ancylostoma duodenale]|uniref:Cytochrome b5 n=1 Tax=Ancylostoma duodenale TaxID=51022 RepID=A0A0C2H4D6_9BILA|nr:putative cytochrome b5 [Ancylostoma duodenale]